MTSLTKLTRPVTGATLLPVGTPTFADLLERLEYQPDLSATRRRDLASGLRRVAAALGLAPVNVHAHAPWLQPRIASLNCQALGLSPKSWSNILSDCRAAMALLDRIKPRANRRTALSPAWRTLWETLVTTDTVGSIERSVGSFVFFLSRISVAPEDVTNEHAEMFRDELSASNLRRVPEDTYRRVIAAWNRAAAQWPFWPQQRLSAPSRIRVIRADPDDLPESFQDDLERYLRSLAAPDILSDDPDARPLREATIKAHENQIRLFAGALVRSGISPETVVGLDVLVRPEHVRKGLTWLFQNNGGKPLPTHLHLAKTLVVVARRHVRVDDRTLEELQQFATRLKMQFPRQRGMTEKNTERLRAFRDPEVLAKLLALPEHLFARGQALGPTSKGLILMRDGVLLALLRNHPLRRKNLVELRFDENLDRTGAQGAFLVVREGRVKNRRGIEFEVDPAIVAMIETYITLRGGNSPWLFPRPDGHGPLNLPYVSSRVTLVVQREIGAAFNIHLARHLAAFLFLTHRPGHYEEVRRLLGHSSTSVTLDVYAGFETDAVGRRYSEIIAQSQSEAPKRGTR